MNHQIEIVGNVFAAVAFFVLLLLILTVWRGRRISFILAITALAGSCWAAYLIYRGSQSEVSAYQVVRIEIAHDLAWLIALASLLIGSISRKAVWVIRYGGIILGVAVLLYSAVLEYSNVFGGTHDVPFYLLVYGCLSLAMFAFVEIEQIYRNTRRSQRPSLKFLCLGIGGIFAYDVALYSSAAVTGTIDSTLLDVRGFAVAMCVPLLAIALHRSPGGNARVFASRQVVTYVTALVAAGLFLSAVLVAGYWAQRLGESWGSALRLVVYFAAAIVFLVLVASVQVRAMLRMYLMKHFKAGKYDYRQEWLRLIETITSANDGLPLRKRVIKSLAEIVATDNGHLWLKGEQGDSFHAISSWDSKPLQLELASDDPLVDAMTRTGWIHDLEEIAERPLPGGSLCIGDVHPQLLSLGLFIPLVHDQVMIGFIGLSRSKTPKALDSEDYEFLKTVGKQIAGYLAQEAATAQLAQNRQFEPYNRFAAYIMHDLKNAIAQQSLFVDNAEIHKRNPKFVDDSIDTIKRSLIRLRRVLDNLREGPKFQCTERVDIINIVIEAKAECSDRSPIPILTIATENPIVIADRDGIFMSICHAIRNAQDATQMDGDIDILVESNSSTCKIHVTDNGLGMDEAFVRERLFKPFDSTKGREGMGIGAHQIRETVRAYGGDVMVSSELNKGTCIVIELPLATDGDL